LEITKDVGASKSESKKKQEILKNRNFLLFYMRTICFLIWEVAFDSLF